MLLQGSSMAIAGEATGFECDTVPGHLSKVTIVQDANERGLTGTVVPKALYKHAQWAPTSQIRLSNADGSGWVSIIVGAPIPKKDVSTVGTPVTLVIERGADGKK